MENTLSIDRKTKRKKNLRAVISFCVMGALLIALFFCIGQHWKLEGEFWGTIKRFIRGVQR